MGECDLDVHGRCDHVAYHYENEAVPVIRDTAVANKVAEPVPEEDLSDDFEVAMPPRRTFAWALAEQDVCPAQDVEVKASKCKYRVVEPMLISQHELRERIIGHDLIIVRTPQTLKEAMRDGEERHMLYIRIMLRRISNNMMDVVIALPPANTQAAEEVGDENADAGVDVEVEGVEGGHLAEREEEVVVEESASSDSCPRWWLYLIRALPLSSRSQTLLSKTA